MTEHARIDDYGAAERGLAPSRDARRPASPSTTPARASRAFATSSGSPRDFIKLDRTLIDRIESDRSQQALAAGLISFAEKSGATIIAEGIERQAEVSALGDLGVSYGQGFFFAKPAPLAELSLEPLARKRRAAG